MSRAVRPLPLPANNEPGPCHDCARRSTCRAACERLERLLERPLFPRRDLSLIEGRHAARPAEPEAESAGDDRRAHALHVAIAELPLEERAVVRAALDGASGRDIAQRTGRSAAAVVRLHDRAVHLLRFRLSDGDDPLPTNPSLVAPSAAAQEDSVSHHVAPRPSPENASVPLTSGPPRRCARPHCLRLVHPTEPSNPGLAPFCSVHRRMLAVAELPIDAAVASVTTRRASVVPDEAGAESLFRAIEGSEAVMQDISPALALALLRRNQNNRTVTPYMVESFRRDMVAGAWRVNNQGIGLGRDGGLYDGQHRLLAVVAAEVTVRMLVVRCLDESSRATIDMGRARRIGDVLRMLDGEESGTRVVTWVRALELVHGRKIVVMSTHAARTEVRRYRRSIDWMLANGPRNRPYNRALVVAALLYAHHVLGETIEPFIEGYARGAGLAPGSPALALRTFVGERLRPTVERDRGSR